MHLKGEEIMPVEQNLNFFPPIQSLKILYERIVDRNKWKSRIKRIMRIMRIILIKDLEVETNLST